jgi:hypothetical protein
MKTLKIIGLLALLSGCSVNGLEIESAIKACHNKEGLDSLFGSRLTNEVAAICNDGDLVILKTQPGNL